MIKMKDTNYLIKGNPFTNSSFIYKAVLFYILLVLSIYFIYLGLSHKPFVSLEEVFIGSFIISLLTIFVYFDVKDRYFLEVTTDQILLKNIFGKTMIIDRSNVLSFFERKRVIREERRIVETWLEIKLYLESSSYVFSEKEYNNYSHIKTVITKNLPSLVRTLAPVEDNRQDYIETLKRRLFRRGFWIVVVMLFPFGKHFITKYTKSDISYEKLIELRGNIEEYPEIIRSGKPAVEEGFILKLSGFPYFNFFFEKEKFDNIETYKSFRDALKNGEIIGVYMSKDEYKKKITLENKINFGDKYFDFNKVKTFGAKYRSKELKTYDYWRRKVEVDKDDTDPLSLYNYVFMYGYVGVLAILLIFFSQDLHEYNIEKDM